MNNSIFSDFLNSLSKLVFYTNTCKCSFIKINNFIINDINISDKYIHYNLDLVKKLDNHCFPYINNKQIRQIKKNSNFHFILILFDDLSSDILKFNQLLIVSKSLVTSKIIDSQSLFNFAFNDFFSTFISFFSTIFFSKFYDDLILLSLDFPSFNAISSDYNSVGNSPNSCSNFFAIPLSTISLFFTDLNNKNISFVSEKFASDFDIKFDFFIFNSFIKFVNDKILRTSHYFRIKNKHFHLNLIPFPKNDDSNLLPHIVLGLKCILECFNSDKKLSI